MPDFNPSVFWPERKAAGMLSVATDADGDFDVSYQSPDQDRNFSGAISREHRIKYQHSDRPNLAEGDTMTITAASGDGIGSFRVRQRPIIPDDGAATGFFRYALLTKV